jgi:DNA-binding NarL/FixJ family response regulator
MNRVLLVDDHTSFREMLAFVFEREPEFVVSAQAGSLAETRHMLDGVDLAVIDLDLPDGNGTALIDEVLSINPHAIILILTANPAREVHARVIQAGAAGVVHKSARVKDIIDAARRLTAGEAILSVNEVFDLLRIAGRLQERDYKSQQVIDRLTPREREVIGALADGLSNKEISERLGLSNATVGDHFMSIYKKLEVNSRLQALVFALRHGIVDVDRARDR